MKFSKALMILFVIISFQAKAQLINNPYLELLGISETHQKDILNQYPYLINSEPSSKDINDITLFLMKTKKYENIFSSRKIENNKNLYKLEAKPLKTIFAIEFAGNHEFDSFTLRDLIDLKPDKELDLQKASEGGENLKDFYGNQGFFNTQIQIEFINKKNNQILVKYLIQEKKRCLIKKISIHSQNPDVNLRLQLFLRKYLNEPTIEETLVQMNNTAKEFFTNNRFVTAELSQPEINYSDDKSESFIKFKIMDPFYYQFSFVGNASISESKIYSDLNLENFYKTTPHIEKELVDMVKLYYLEKGYAHVNITSSIEKSDDGFRKLIFLNIEEGPRVKINTIDFSGRYTKALKYYKQLLLKDAPPLIEDGFYNRSFLEKASENLIIKLQNEGFLKAKIISIRTQYEKNKELVNISISIEEGPLTLVREVSFKGIKSFTDIQLKKIISIQNNSPLQLNQLEFSIQKLKSFYLNKGFLEMKILNESSDLLEFNSNNTQVNVTYKIHEGPQVRVGSILIEGNNMTHERIILLELEFSVDDILTPEKINDSILRLQRTGLFSSIQITTLEENTDISNRTVLVKLKERDPGIFHFGLGFSNEKDLTLRGFTGIAYRNLQGVGRSLSARFEANTSIANQQDEGARYIERKILLGYAERYLFFSRTQGNINITSKDEFSDFDLRKINRSTSAGFSLERHFTSHVRGNYKLWEITHIKEFIAGPVYIDVETDVPRNIATTGPLIEFDYRDNPFIPTRGSFTRLGIDYSSPNLGSDDGIEFLSSTAQFTHYSSWGSPQKTWANSLRGGHLKNLASEKYPGIPFNQIGFSLGGQSTLRGFKSSSRERFPNYVDLNIAEGANYFIESESQFYLFKSEIRFPISGDLGGAIFYDGGAVLIQGVPFDDPYRDSAGLGIHYNTPVGALVAEIGYKLDRKRNPKLRDESEFEFHISIGTF